VAGHGQLEVAVGGPDCWQSSDIGERGRTEEKERGEREIMRERSRERLKEGKGGRRRVVGRPTW